MGTIAKWALAIGSATLLLSGCENPPLPVVPDAAGRPVVGPMGISCDEPVALPRDCSALSGPKRRINLDGVRFKIAASENGRTLFLMGPNQLSLEHGPMTNAAYEVMKADLAERGIRVAEVSPIGGMGQLVGYLVRFDGDAYAALMPFSEAD